LANGRHLSRFKEANNCKIQSSKRKEDRNHAFLPLLFLFSSSCFAPSEDVTERHLVHGLAEALELLQPDPFKPRQILLDLTLQIRSENGQKRSVSELVVYLCACPEPVLARIKQWDVFP
jgi:hypothetical protein